MNVVKPFVDFTNTPVLQIKWVKSLTFLKILVAFSLFLAQTQLQAQKLPSPSAYFSFNNHAANDEVSKRPIQLSGLSYTRDRFGNDNSAIYLYGNSKSFINLGSSDSLKPKTGTICLWVNIAKAVWSGQGYRANPLLLAKRSADDDFFEAYGFYYEYELGSIAVCVTKDSVQQMSVRKLENIDLNTWIHLALTYSNDSMALYMNGKFIQKSYKGFETEFWKGDSVLVGVSHNAKNNRYSHMTVDDIAFYSAVLSPQQINSIYNAPNPNKLANSIRLIFYFVLALLVLFILVLGIKRRLQKQLEKERQALELQKKMLETELRVNRALMNPHFVFNAMNAVQGLILKNETVQAHDYLMKFSKLMRLILESNTGAAISLETEIDILKRYIEIEEMRFDGSFNCNFEIDPHLQKEQLFIPIMLVQPFVENAIWHGLLHKEGNRQLTISFARTNSQLLLCTIDDNGLGRQSAAVNKRPNKSLAIQFIQQRLAMLNKLHVVDCNLIIIDKANSSGTTVNITLPIINNLQ